MKRSVATIVAPAGVEKIQDKNMPITVPTTEQITEHITIFLKFLNSFIAVNDGKIRRAEMSRAPTSFIANTMITAEIKASSILYVLV